MPSRGSALAVAVARTTLSPSRTTAAPWACLANFPVSNEICLPPARSTVMVLTSGFMIHSFSLFTGGQLPRPPAKTQEGRGTRGGAGGEGVRVQETHVWNFLCWSVYT